MASSSRDELIFETPDVKPRVEEKTDGRHDHPSGQEVADIDTSPVDLKAAYQAHQSRADAVRRDASSRGTVSAGRDGSYESPRQRLERLRAETRELEEYLETMSATSAATESGSIAAVRRADVVGLVADVEQLQAQLQRIGTEEKFRPLLDAEAQLQFALSQQGQLSRKMIDSIGAIAGNGSESSGGGRGGGDDAAKQEPITYELFMQSGRRGGSSGAGGGGATAEASALKYGALEDRLAALERAVGGGGSSTSGGAMVVYDIAGELAKLRERVELLDPERLELISAQMAKVGAEFKAFAEVQSRAGAAKRAGSSEAGEEMALAQKVEELYSMVQSVDATAEALPDIVARLRTLQQLHAEGALFTQRLHALDAAHVSTQQLLVSDKELLGTVEASFAGNVATIEGNITLLDERVAKIVGTQ